MSQRVGSIKKLLGSARAMRWGMNIWPPFLFTGVRIQHISADFRIARIKLAKTPFTTNYFGTQFGGTMFSMVDPFWAFMLYRNLGSDYVVWDRRGEIDFESGRTALYQVCSPRRSSTVSAPARTLGRRCSLVRGGIARPFRRARREGAQTGLRAQTALNFADNATLARRSILT